MPHPVCGQTSQLPFIRRLDVRPELHASPHHLSRCLVNYNPFNQTSQSHSKEGGDTWLVDDGDNSPNRKRRTDNGKFDTGPIKPSRTARSSVFEKRSAWA